MHLLNYTDDKGRDIRWSFHDFGVSPFYCCVVSSGKLSGGATDRYPGPAYLKALNALNLLADKGVNNGR